MLLNMKSFNLHKNVMSIQVKCHLKHKLQKNNFYLFSDALEMLNCPPLEMHGYARVEKYFKFTQFLEN